MILTTAAVGDKYVQDLERSIPSIADKFDSCFIYTDCPERFASYNVKVYYREVWSYVEKLLFALRVCVEEKKDVIFIDEDQLKYLNVNALLNFKFDADSIMFYDYWKDPKLDVYLTKYEQLDSYWIEFKHFFISKHINIPRDLPLPLEWLFYFPYSNKLTNVLINLEKIQPLLEYSALKNYANGMYFDRKTKLNIGNGEGLGLAIAAYISGIKLKKINQKSFFSL